MAVLHFGSCLLETSPELRVLLRPPIVAQAPSLDVLQAYIEDYIEQDKDDVTKPDWTPKMKARQVSCD